MKYIIREDVGSVYWLDNGVLCYAPLNADNSFDTDELGEVDNSFADEPIGAFTLGDIWSEVIKELTK